MASQTQEQDRVAALTRDAGTTIRTHIWAELDYTPQTSQERERVEAWLQDRNEPVSQNKDSAPPWSLSKIITT